jgi:diguanylate cyclase (GGDEF)-like protein
VLGLWRRQQGIPLLRPQDRELALTVAGNLASIIRAEQANAQVRQKGARESLINSVSEQIQQSLKEVKPILHTLVSQLAEYFDLSLSAVSIYDSLNSKFLEPQCAGRQFKEDDDNSLLVHLAENLFQSQMNSLSNQDFLTQPMPALMLNPSDIREALGDLVVDLPESMKITMIFPLRQGNNLKGALCMVSDQEKTPSLPDMRMIQDLLNRVAVVVEHKELFEKIERQAITDGLTGLYNRRYFEEQLNKELDRHQRFGHSCSYIILDLDHFKSVNDTLDHLNGDIALKHTAAIVKKCVRDVDTVGRLGGEEFVVLLPESDENAAMVVAERICTTLRESTIEAFKSEDNWKKIEAKLQEGKITDATAKRLSGGRVTASVGVSTFPKDAQDKTRLMELADKYLYLAKGRGRNQVCTSKHDTGEAMPEPSSERTPEVKQTPPPAVPQLPVPSAALPMPAGSSPLPPGIAQIDLQMIAEHGILGMLSNVVKAVSTKDGYNDERTPRASDYASRIAHNLRLSKEHTTIISLAAVLNNLGKCVVDEQVLRKSGPLSPDEWRLVENAPSTAAKILEPARHLHRVAIVVESYHEHWDGSGYPRGLKGEDIPLESRIISVVDAFVAMTSDRPYRPALSRAEAISILQKGAGKEWDPRIVKLFLAILDKESKGI